MRQDVGLDIGTMNLVSAKLDSENNIQFSQLRNVFLEVDLDGIGTLDLSKITHTIIDDKVYILSQDAFNFANIFNKQVNRPMEKGLVSPKEIDSAEILAVMIKHLIGTSDQNSKCIFSVPADPIDAQFNNIYHQNVFQRVISQLGYEAIPLNEAIAIIYSELYNNDFSGIAISFGAGMTNVGLAYKSVPVLTFSVARGGDWIDLNAANATATVPNRVTLIKESPLFNLTDLEMKDVKKKERKIREALIHYYKALINYVAKNIIEKLKEVQTDFPEDLPFVISGGTSLANGFIEIFQDAIKNYEFPFGVSKIIKATNPLTAVAQGCLIKALR